MEGVEAESGNAGTMGDEVRGGTKAGIEGLAVVRGLVNVLDLPSAPLGLDEAKDEGEEEDKEIRSGATGGEGRGGLKLGMEGLGGGAEDRGLVKFLDFPSPVLGLDLDSPPLFLGLLGDVERVDSTITDGDDDAGDDRGETTDEDTDDDDDDDAGDDRGETTDEDTDDDDDDDEAEERGERTTDEEDDDVDDVDEEEDEEEEWGARGLEGAEDRRLIEAERTERSGGGAFETRRANDATA